jgi:translation elongation factor EF-1alpha
MQEIPIVLIGEKDHGKSTLIGRLLLDTKTIGEKKIKEIKEAVKALGKEFELAHLVDAFKEEREMEMTMDTTTTLVEGKKRNYLLIDVPGHEELISQMLTGTSRGKIALLLVAVDEGIKEQTIKHLEIAKLLGIEKVGVVLNKMDKVNYKKEVFKKLKEEIEEILEKVGYFSKNVHFFPVSAKNGDNVIIRSRYTLWYQGKTLFEFLESLKDPEILENYPLRFLIQDKYLIENEEVLVGKIEAGRMRLNQNILFLPEKEKAKIKKIKEFEENLKEARVGQNVGLILDKTLKIKRGSVGCLPDFPVKVSNLLKGECFWIDVPKNKKISLECGTAKVEAEILEPSFRVLEKNQKTFYKIKLEKEIAFDKETILNKIVLKDKGKIIAVGNILCS